MLTNTMLNKSEFNMCSSQFPYALFGLPFDPVSLEQTKTLIREAIKTKKQLLIATPNVNFVAMASKDRSFYQSILECDLSIVDGTPLFWLLKLLKSPLPEKVPGSTLIESLTAETSAPPIKAFFLGGQDDTAAQASAVLNKNQGGVISVGACNPGFGSIETMSRDEIISTINEAAPDFLIVSLGAQKGHKWIQHNREKLNVPVISHLGAVVNFVAGTKKRSPKLLQRLGAEWLWRIYQEPSLYRRYAGDAVVLAKLVFMHFAPALISKIKHKPDTNHSGRFEVTITASKITYTLTGDLCSSSIEKLFASLQQLQITKGTAVCFDMSQTTFIDSRLAGVILRLQGICGQNLARLEIIHTAPAIKKMLQNFMIDI